MHNISPSLVLIFIVILSLALAPWILLSQKLPLDKLVRTTALKGALITFLAVILTVGTLVLAIDAIGEYGVYLMMISLIFGSWLGYVVTKNRV